MESEGYSHLPLVHLHAIVYKRHGGDNMVSLLKAQIVQDGLRRDEENLIREEERKEREEERLGDRSRLDSEARRHYSMMQMMMMALCKRDDKGPYQ